MALAQINPFSNHPETIESYNPANGEEYRRYELHTQEEAENIIEESHEAFLRWKETSFSERADILRNMAQLLTRDKMQLAEMMTRQMGKPIAQGEAEIDICIEICRYNAEHGADQLADEERSVDQNLKGIITYQPLGVILGMQPWNFPVYQCLRYAVPTLMAGNSTVFKHAPICFETAERIETMFEEAGLPKNVFRAIYVDDETADALISHDKVRGVNFTGSAAGGKTVAKEAGAHLKKTVMELGGSDAYLVLKDADLDAIMESCVRGRVNNAGQTCIAAKRFIVEAQIYDAFKEKFVAAMKEVRYGDPMDRSNDMGPLAREDLREKLHKQVQETIDKGATCLCGGKVPEGKGCYYPPTVLENIPKDSPAYRDELFGPVASLFKAADEEEAIEIANDHRYGLGGGVFSSDIDKATEIARTRIEAGLVNVNQYGVSKPNMPFGGVKESGYGREHGGFGIKEFVNIKSVVIATDTSVKS